MKVLLAPLFFHSRFCKHCARIFYKENPGSWVGIHEFESLPPLGSFDTKRGFIPDFPTLLMFDEFVLDGEALERLKNFGNRLWLREWSEVVVALESEGSLTVNDVSAAAGARPHKRGWMLRRDLDDPQRWWQAMGYYNALTCQAQRLLGDSPREAQDFSWKFDPDASFGIQGEDGEVHDLAVVLQDTQESNLEAHRELYATAIDALKTQLREVNSCITACDELGCAPVMWAPYRRYLEEKLTPTVSSNSTKVEAAGRQFFEVAFPAYSPTTVRAFAKLRSDKRIKALRAEILEASQKGKLLDPQYPQRTLTEVLHLEQKAARVRRIAGWIATAVGTIPVPGLGIAAATVAEAITSRLKRNERKPWHWFYLISDGRGAT